MEITEKVAYLKGLAEGMELDTEKKEGKLLAAIIDVLDDIALEIADMKADQEELYDGLDAVSDDLEDVEDAVFGEDDEDEEDVYEYEEPEEDEDCYATTCPPARRPSTSTSPSWRTARSSAPTAARSWSSI